jgi:hypothetical protein
MPRQKEMSREIFETEKSLRHKVSSQRPTHAHFSNLAWLPLPRIEARLKSKLLSGELLGGVGSLQRGASVTRE